MNNFQDVVVTQNIKIRESILILEKSNKKIVLVVDDNFRLIATISDGDIRRGILKGISLENCISEIYHIDFISINENKRKTKKDCSQQRWQN